MILPSKQLNHNRALLSVGADVLRILTEPKTVSRVWDELQRSQTSRFGEVIVTYDWFILALDLLFAMSAIDLDAGRLRRIIR